MYIEHLVTKMSGSYDGSYKEAENLMDKITVKTKCHLIATQPSMDRNTIYVGRR